MLDAGEAIGRVRTPISSPNESVFHRQAECVKANSLCSAALIAVQGSLSVASRMPNEHLVASWSLLDLAKSSTDGSSASSEGPLCVRASSAKVPFDAPSSNERRGGMADVFSKDVGVASDQAAMAAVRLLLMSSR